MIESFSIGNKMRSSVGIIAPLLDEDYQANFVVKIDYARNLTFKLMYELVKNNYSIASLSSVENFKIADASAGGYYLSSYLRLNGYNTFLTSQHSESSFQQMMKTNPIAICISSTMLKRKQSLSEIVAKIRNKMPDIPVIVGGGLVWKSYLWLNILQNNGEILNKLAKDDESKEWPIFPAERNQLNVDVFIVSPHGSTILLQVLKKIESNKAGDFSDIPNLAIPTKDGNFVLTTRIDEIVDYNRDYTNWNILDELPLRVPIRTSVGCAYRCIFCDFCQLHPNLFLRSLESIESELKSLKQTISTRHPNILNLFFTDDNVFSNQSRIQGICDTIVHSRINKLWAGFVRADQITSSNIDLIRTSGLSFSIVGVESGDQGQLLRMDKKNNLKKIRDGIELLDAAGIPTLMTFVVGFPGENKDTIANTAGFINGLQQKSGFLSYQLYPLHLSPLSLLASDKIRKQWKIKGMFSDWSHYTMNSTEVDIRLKTIFESAQDVNYHYPNESYFFLKRFSACDLKKLANLRNQLALLLMKKNPLNNIMPLFEEFARAFKLKPTYPSRSFLNQLTIRN